MLYLKMLFITFFIPVVLQASPTEIIYLSGRGSDDAIEWDFFCTKGRKSGKWNKIKVPSCWEMEGFGSFNYGMDKVRSDEEGLYKRTFQIPDSWNGKKIFIVFEGSMTDTKIKVNNKQAGEIHQGGYTRFRREITELVKYRSENLLEVIVSKESANKSVNDAERYADFWVFGGIFRPVYLEALPGENIERVAVNAQMEGDIKAEIFLSEPLSDISVSMTITDKNGIVKGKISSEVIDQKENKIKLSGKIDNIESWSAESPTLYKAKFELNRKGKFLHSVSENIGFRTVEVRANDGIYINGVKTIFKGVNRHTNWPTTGRTVNKTINLQDALLIKEMNMNAVRLHCYTPDKDFLHMCDSLGLYVTDELCQWHLPLDREIGAKLVNELIARDVNHPSVIFWANGNEGGFNFDLDTLFTFYDIQKRPVLHPWTTFSNINTIHYPPYNSGISNQFNGREIVMPTEFLHGLYDGGLGAGLDDFWNQMMDNPRSAGGFLWDFVDLGIIRSDKNNVMDTDTNHGADGILGPYREKEGSFYTIKEIFSPVILEKRIITPLWNGELTIENRYTFTNTKECTFSYTLTKIKSVFPPEVDNLSGKISSPAIEPGARGKLNIDLPPKWSYYDILDIIIKDKSDKEIYKCSYELGNPLRIAERLLKKDGAQVTLEKTDSIWTLSASGVQLSLDEKTGQINTLFAKGKFIPLSDGPMFIQSKDLVCQSVTGKESDSIKQVIVRFSEVTNTSKNYFLTWTMYPSGIIGLEYSYPPTDMTTMAGITFNFPEEGIKGAALLSNGPYRVYKNRMKGGTLGFWNKDYNNTITGESWIYPEFKGYYSLFYGMRLDCATPFEVYSGTEDTFLHLFTPGIQTGIEPEKNYTVPKYPDGNISFMQAIPAVGGKFDKAENFGPQSMPYRLKINRATTNFTGKLFFKFF